MVSSGKRCEPCAGFDVDEVREMRFQTWKMFSDTCIANWLRHAVIVYLWCFTGLLYVVNKPELMFSKDTAAGYTLDPQTGGIVETWGPPKVNVN